MPFKVVKHLAAVAFTKTGRTKWCTVKGDGQILLRLIVRPEHVLLMAIPQTATRR